MTKYWRYKRRNYILAYGKAAWLRLIAKKKRKKYLKTPRGQYSKQKTNARRRGISFLLTFSEWWSIWESSGHYGKRGHKKGCYQMARIKDAGAYEVGNVIIVKLESNAYASLISSRCSRLNQNSKFAAEVAAIL